ncbi:nuclear transport factor 2 family protein [Maribacter sp. 2307ULW6-5]|uniref:nuclear transport factor 2 family protein n=1 Tax=Maribacter sp. 2307ULW6-5 TaxID=3386275 RepID=UPI0039BC5485
MKYLLTVFFLCLVLTLGAQTPQDSVKQAVLSFFGAFHDRDAQGMRQWLHKDAILRRTAPNAQKVHQLKKQSFEDLINGIVAIPDSTQFEERLLDFKIETDGPLAHVWTPYAFYLQGKFHHGGANSIQLFKEGDRWQIIYLVDSRTLEGGHKNDDP